MDLIDNQFISKTIFSILAIFCLVMYLICFGKLMNTNLFIFDILSFILTITFCVIFIFFASNFIKSNISIYIILSILFTIVYCCFCTFCDNNIATYSNIISTMILGILLALNSFIWTIFEVLKCTINIKGVGGLTQYETCEFLTNIFLFPFVLMTIGGTIVCGYKDYESKKQKVK